jgi:hypothetical protein
MKEEGSMVILQKNATLFKLRQSENCFAGE